jgi:hypothetical protein
MGTNVLRVFLLSIHSLLPPTPPPPRAKVVRDVNIVYGNLKSDKSQDYVQKPQRNCTFLNSASVFCKAILLDVRSTDS